MLWLRVLSWLRREEGQDLTEYALLLALIILLAIAAVIFLGESISRVLSSIASHLASAMGVGP